MGNDRVRPRGPGSPASAVADPAAAGAPSAPPCDGGRCFDDTRRIVPWYVDLAVNRGGAVVPGIVPRRGGARGGAGPCPCGAAAGRGALRPACRAHHRIQGFTSAGAVAPGESLDFRVTVDPPRQFRADVYRIGHYGGDGAARITGSPRLSGLVQPAPLAAGRTVSCHHWWVTWRLHVPSYWREGAYVAVLTAADGQRCRIPFTVRALPDLPGGRGEERPGGPAGHRFAGEGPPPAAPGYGRPAPAPRAGLLLVLPDVTWQAYNLYPEDGRGGAGLHHAWDGRGRLLGEEGAASTVSFDRPYAGPGLPLHAGHAYDVIRWAERCGYDLAYACAQDLHAGRVDPARHRGLVFPGHDECWTDAMRQAAERARDRGTSLVFLSARTLYRRVGLAPSPSGAPDRLLGGRGRTGPGRPAPWRETGRPEQQLLGVQYGGRAPEPHPLVVRNAHHWLWEATGAGEGDELPGLVAGETDRYFPRTPLPEHTRRILLAHSPYRDAGGVLRHQETSLYRAPSGALVFAAGTLGWSPALDRPGHVDPRIQRATANVLDRVCAGE